MAKSICFENKVIKIIVGSNPAIPKLYEKQKFDFLCIFFYTPQSNWIQKTHLLFFIKWKSSINILFFFF